MACQRPFISSAGAFGCGQCLSCRTQRRRIWQHRILLEALLHEHTSFVTLTYSDGHLPLDSSLRPRDLTLFLKRLRKVHSSPIRYFACGEYGETTRRPHYHLALFGFGGCQWSRTRAYRATCCDSCSLIQSTWGLGNVFLGTLEPASATYIAGYVTKGGTPPIGLVAPFARMSRRPGLGALMMDEVASVLLDHKLDDILPDVPLTLAHGTKTLPLGPYLRRLLRERIGRSKYAPEAAYTENKEKLRLLRETAWKNARPLLEVFLEETLGRRIQLEAREQRYRKAIL